MTSVFYISPSVLPSRAANAVHVVHQCAGFAQAGAAVTLVAKRNMPDPAALPGAIADTYGVPAGTFRTESFFSQGGRGDNLKIAALALRRLAAARSRPGLVLSRNLYAAWVLAVLRRWPLVFETHQLETGARKALQRAVMTRPNVVTVVISEKLKDILAEHHGVGPARPLVLHDAAPAGIRPLPAAEKRRVLAGLVPALAEEEEVSRWDAVCGYFGHLYPGRGVEVIEAMAEARPRSLFVLFGGNDSDIAARRATTRLANLIFAGFLPHAVAQRAMAACDVLLMPYQRSVSIGVAGHDTARWMSPMKMFEYLASGTPVISSDLPVLREVLTDGRNALLASPDDPGAWLAALDRLTDDSGLAAAIGTAGHRSYAADHTWARRAEAILATAGEGCAP